MDSDEHEPLPDEVALQDWLEEAYRNQGYTCYNWHRMERVNEKGMDLECDSTEEKVALAVKIRPKKGDIQQLEKFSKISATRKTYVYWIPPTRDFQKRLEQSGIESLGNTALKDFLVKHGSVGYMKWRFIKTATLGLVTQTILEIYECEGVPIREFSKDDIGMIWRLKSATVKLKADIRLTKNYYDEIIMREKNPSAAVAITGSALEQIDMMEADAKELFGVVSNTRKQAPHILRAFIDRISDRTGGIDLHVAMTKTTTAERPAQIERWLIEDKEAHKFLSALTWLSISLENLEDRFSLLSLGVDWVFQDVLFQLWRVKSVDLSDD